MSRLLMSLLIICIPFIAEAQTVKLWKWTPQAAHHDAIVYVKTANGFAGTGTLIQVNTEGSYGVVLTAAHVIGSERNVYAEWQTGQKANGRVLYCSQADDVAMIAVNPPNGAVAIPLTANAPPVGAAVECIGLGSPMSSLRHYAGTVMSVDGNQMTVKTPVTHGDSGGAIVYNGRVVGTITGGYNTVHHADGFNIYSPLIGSNVVALKKAAVHCQCEYGSCPVQKPDIDPSQWLPSIQPVPAPDPIKPLDPLDPITLPVVPPDDGASIQPVPNRDIYLLAILWSMRTDIIDLQSRVAKLEAAQITISDAQRDAVMREILYRLKYMEARRRTCFLGLLRR